MSLSGITAELKQIVSSLDTLNTKANTVLDKADSILDETKPVVQQAQQVLAQAQGLEKKVTTIMWLLAGILVAVFLVFVVSAWVRAKQRGQVLKQIELGRR